MDQNEVYKNGLLLGIGLATIPFCVTGVIAFSKIILIHLAVSRLQNVTN
jgi:hypothetical protein